MSTNYTFRKLPKEVKTSGIPDFQCLSLPFILFSVILLSLFYLATMDQCHLMSLDYTKSGKKSRHYLPKRGWEKNSGKTVITISCSSRFDSVSSLWTIIQVILDLIKLYWSRLRHICTVKVCSEIAWSMWSTMKGLGISIWGNYPQRAWSKAPWSQWKNSINFSHLWNRLEIRAKSLAVVNWHTSTLTSVELSWFPTAEVYITITILSIYMSLHLQSPLQTLINKGYLSPPPLRLPGDSSCLLDTLQGINNWVKVETDETDNIPNSAEIPPCQEKMNGFL